MLLKSHLIDSGDVERIVESVSRYCYAGNLTCEVRDVGRTSRTGFNTRFTLGVRHSKAHGARRSSTGRHGPWASWEAHRDVMEAIYAKDISAKLVTAFATYTSEPDFRAKFPATGEKNVGSEMHPMTMRDCTV